MTSVRVRERRQRHTGEKADKAETRVVEPQAEGARGATRSWLRQGTESFLKPSERSWHRHPLKSRPPASRT